MAPKKIKTTKDALKRACFTCHVTKAHTNTAFLFDDKAFANPLVAYFFYLFLSNKKEEERMEMIARIRAETQFNLQGVITEKAKNEELLLCSMEDSSTFTCVWNQEALIDAEDFNKLVEAEEDETFDEEKPPKTVSYVYILEEDTVTQLEQKQGQPLNQVLPVEMWYMGEEYLVHKNRDIPVKFYVTAPDVPAPYINELFLKYFGKREHPPQGRVYLHSQQHLPMLESSNLALDKEMEKMDVEQEIKEKKKKARVPRKKVMEAMSKIADSESGSVDEAAAVAELQQLTSSKPKGKKRISGSVLKEKKSKKSKGDEDSCTQSRELSVTEESPSTSSEEGSPKATKPKRVKKTEEQKEAEKQAKEQAKAAKEAEKAAAKKAKEDEKAKKQAEKAEAKRVQKESKQNAKQQASS